MSRKFKFIDCDPRWTEGGGVSFDCPESERRLWRSPRRVAACLVGERIARGLHRHAVAALQRRVPHARADHWRRRALLQRLAQRPRLEQERRLTSDDDQVRRT